MRTVAAAQKPFTKYDARQARQSYQRIAFIVNRLLAHIIAGLDEAGAAKFKPSVFQTVHSLNGMFNGRDLSRAPMFQAHVFTAQHFDHKGDPANAEKLVGRRLNDLRDAEIACGLRLFKITRADGIKQVLTSYEAHYLLDAAEWLYLQARTSPDYFKNPAKAITDELLADAVARLPEIPEQERAAAVPAERGEMDAGDLMTDAVLKGQRTKLLDRLKSHLKAETDNGKDPILVCGEIKCDLDDYARELHAQKSAELERRRREAWYDKDTEETEGSGNRYAGQVARPDTLEEVQIGDERGDIRGGGTPEETQDGQEVSESGEFSMLEWALFWARQSVAVFPVHSAFDAVCSCPAGSECKSAGKHPKTASGLKEATTDEAQIARWWRKWPDANIGGAMGGDARLLAVDVDPKSGGDANLCNLIEAHGDAWLKTLHVETGSLGSHFFYTYPLDVELRNSAGKIAVGIDTRAEGGYVVLPPSIHVSGRRYRIKSPTQIQPVPAWLIEELTRPLDQKPPVVVNFQERRARASGGGIIGEGERNERMFKIGCAIWGSGEARDVTDLHAQLLQVNAERCSPPLTDPEVSQIVGSINRYPRGKHVPVEATA